MATWTSFCRLFGPLSKAPFSLFIALVELRIIECTKPRIRVVSSLKRGQSCWERCTQIQPTSPVTRFSPFNFLWRGEWKCQEWRLAVPMHLQDLLDTRLPSLLCVTVLNFSSRMASAGVRQTLFRRDVDKKLNYLFSKGTKIVDRFRLLLNQRGIIWVSKVRMTFLVTSKRSNETLCSGIVLSAWITKVEIVYNMEEIGIPVNNIKSRVVALRVSLEIHSLTIVNWREMHKVILETRCNATGSYVPPS